LTRNETYFAAPPAYTFEATMEIEVEAASEYINNVKRRRLKVASYVFSSP
jgi:hypothetical protein